MNLSEIKAILCPKCKGYAEQYRRDSIIGFKCSCGWDSNDGTRVLTINPTDNIVVIQSDYCSSFHVDK